MGNRRHEPTRTSSFTGFELANAGFLTKRLTVRLGPHRRDTPRSSRSLPTGNTVCIWLAVNIRRSNSFSDELSQTNHDMLTFAAERWTKRNPFKFRVEAAASDGEWKEIYNGDKEIRVGRGYLNEVSIPCRPERTDSG